MLQSFPAAADPAFLFFQALGGSLWVVQDLSVSSSEEEEIWEATFSSAEAVAASCSSSPVHTACPWYKAGCWAQAPWMSLVLDDSCSLCPALLQGDELFGNAWSHRILGLGWQGP